LLRRINSQVSEAEHTVVPVELVIRGTTGPAGTRTVIG
jgi:hypothetical protein